MSELFSTERLNRFAAGSQRIMIGREVDVNVGWLRELIAARGDLVRMAERQGRLFILPNLAFVDEIFARHGVDVLSAYRTAVRGFDGEETQT